jgi:KUP system potassium uptake protein
MQYLRGVKHWALPVVGLIMLVFLTVEFSFLIANITKLLNRLGILVFEWGLISMMYVGYRGREIKNSLLSLLPVANTKPSLQELSQDESVTKYASNLVYLTHSKKAGELENEILYSILRKQPKRADRYWFINMSIATDPYSTRYSVEELVPGVAYKINFRLGFRVQPRLNVLFRRVLEQMGERGEIDITSRYDSLARYKMPGDFRFVVLEKVLSHDNQLSFKERFILNGYFFINRFAISDQQLFGLDTSDVALEKVPLTIKPATTTHDLQRDEPEPKPTQVPVASAQPVLATEAV